MKNILLLSSISTYIPLIIAGVFALFVIAGLIWGIIRGLKKQTFRLGWVIAISLILFFVTPFITRGIMGMNLEFLNITIEGIKLTTITNFVGEYAQKLPDYGQIIASNPQTVKMVITLVSLILNSFIYVLMFWLAKIILWPIWAILSATLIKTKVKTADGVVKKPKHRVTGMLVGVVSGIIVGATTLMPIMGISNLVLQIEKNTTETRTIETTNEAGETVSTEVSEGAISSIGGKEIIKYLNDYNNSFTAGMFKYTGIEFFNYAMFNGLSTTTIDKNKIVLKDEIMSVIKTADSLKQISKFQFSNYTKQKLSTLINSVRTLTNNVFEIKSLNVIGNELMPYMINEMLNNPDFVIKLPNTGNQTADDIVNQTLNEIKTITFKDVKNEIDCVLNIAETLNTADILAKVLNKEEYNIKTIFDLINEEYISNITTNMFNMKIGATALPLVINAGFEYAADFLNVTDFTINNENVSAEEVKNFVNSVLNIGYSTYNSLDFNSKFYLTKNSLPLAGKLLNEVINYKGLGTTEADKLILGAETKLRTEASKALSGIDQKFDEIKIEILNSIENLNTVQDFEEEFKTISNVYDDVILLVESMQQNETLNLQKLGSVLDGVKTTKLFGTSVNPIVSKMFNIIGDSVPADLIELKTILNRASLNVNSIESYKIELSKYTNIYKVVELMAADSNLSENIFKTENTYLSDFGLALNDLKSSTLLGNEINNIVVVMVDYANSVAGDTSIVKNAVTKIKENINNSSNINWQAEFVTIKDLVKTAMDYNTSTVTIEQVGESLDLIVAKNSQIITRQVINEVLKSAMDQIAGNVTDVDVQNLINKIKTEIETNNNISYKQEITALNSLLLEVKDININTLDYAMFGQLLDDYDATTGGTPSVIVSAIRQDVVKLAINKIDTTNFNADLVNIINKIKNNVANIESYKNEFIKLKTFVDETEKLKSVDVNNFNFTSFGTILDGFENSKLLNNVRGDVVVLLLNEVKNNTTDLEIKNMVDLMINEVPNITSYTTELEQLQDFINERNNLSNVTYDTFNFVAFGEKLDSYGNSVLLKAVRKEIVNKIVDQVELNSESTNNQIVIAVNDIMTNTKQTATLVEAGELTYKTMFGEIGGLKNKLNELQNINVTVSSHDVTIFGTKLNELNSLTIVPLKSSVRIHKYILDNVKTQVNNLLPANVTEIAALKQASEALVAEINLQSDKCQTYLLGSSTLYNANFVNDYANINTLVENVINLLP